MRHAMRHGKADVRTALTRSRTYTPHAFSLGGTPQMTLDTRKRMSDNNIHNEQGVH